MPREGLRVRRILIVLLITLSVTAPIVSAHPQLVSAATHTIAINGSPNCGTSKFCYAPSSLAVTAGDTVTWVNNSTAPHTVTRCDTSTCSGGGPGNGDQGGPSSPTINASGGTFFFTFTTPGKYKYYSAIHGHGLHGKITVVAATAMTTTTTTATATASAPTTTVASTSTTIGGARAAATRQLTDAFTYTVAIDGTPDCGISMFCYNPSSLAVNEGDTVTWVNNSTAPQTVTRCDPSTCSGNGPGYGGQSGLSSPTINAGGGTFSFTFTSPGTYNYFCAMYGSATMQGAITVDPATTATTTTGFSSSTVTTTGVLLATSGASSSSQLVAASTSASGSHLAGAHAPKSQGIAIALVLLLLGLGLATASTARRRLNAKRLSVAAPESSLTVRLLEDFEAERSMQGPTRR
jgi:plastocyanin